MNRSTKRFISFKLFILLIYSFLLAQSAEAVEYTDCIPAEGYDTKQSDGEASVMLELWKCGISLHCHHSQVYSGLEW